MSSLFLVLLKPFILIGNAALWALGYTVNTDELEVAQSIVATGRSAQDCYNIRYFDFMEPTVDSK